MEGFLSFPIIFITTLNYFIVALNYFTVLIIMFMARLLVLYFFRWNKHGLVVSGCLTHVFTACIRPIKTLLVKCDVLA